MVFEGAFQNLVEYTAGGAKPDYMTRGFDVEQETTEEGPFSCYSDTYCSDIFPGNPLLSLWYNTRASLFLRDSQGAIVTYLKEQAYPPWTSYNGAFLPLRLALASPTERLPHDTTTSEGDVVYSSVILTYTERITPFLSGPRCCGNNVVAKVGDYTHVDKTLTISIGAFPTVQVNGKQYRPVYISNTYVDYGYKEIVVTYEEIM